MDSSRLKTMTTILVVLRSMMMTMSRLRGLLVIGSLHPHKSHRARATTVPLTLLSLALQSQLQGRGALVPLNQSLGMRLSLGLHSPLRDAALGRGYQSSIQIMPMEIHGLHRKSCATYSGYSDWNDKLGYLRASLLGQPGHLGQARRFPTFGQSASCLLRIFRPTLSNLDMAAILTSTVVSTTPSELRPTRIYWHSYAGKGE